MSGARGDQSTRGGEVTDGRESEGIGTWGVFAVRADASDDAIESAIDQKLRMVSGVFDLIASNSCLTDIAECDGLEDATTGAAESIREVRELLGELGLRRRRAARA